MNVAIFGATSAIAKFVARNYAATGANLYLYARDAEKLDALSNDLRIHGASMTVCRVVDFANREALLEIEKSLQAEAIAFDQALVAFGTLTAQDHAEADTGYLIDELTLNGLHVNALTALLARQMIDNRSGHITVIGSVAGDRGRPSNYAYGSAKALVDTFCSGLSITAQKHGVSLLLIKPGFVDTPMTSDLDLPTPLVASAEYVGGKIHSWAQRKESGVRYVPGYWRIIMLIIRLIPGFIFRRLDL